MLGTYITNLMILPIALLITIPLAFAATITISIAFATLCLRLCLVYLDFFSALARAYLHTLPAPDSTTTTIHPHNPHSHTIYSPIHRRNPSQPGILSPTENPTARRHIYTRSPQLLLRGSSNPPEGRKLRRRNSQSTPTLLSPLTRKYSLPTPGSLGSFVGEGNLDGDFEPIDGLFRVPTAVTTRSQNISSISSDNIGDAAADIFGH
ncbi:hypothetical protein GX50_05128 [[Emmonsia] crescens]|uniref:Uncharacterized protein n=1 Tax=[Emmonsia] crescens TaxID=73230 RepID=A0A2B7ZGH0_9EURO|nr:hypothetical protein GX50_05128 [Emmonsia crescens]